MAEAKSKTVYEDVQMTDGRTVAFAGKRKVNKETIVDESRISVDGDVVTFGAGAVSIRMDFRNGETRTYALPASLIARFAGHGAEQKYGDELASPADKPMSVEDMVCAVDDLHSRITQGSWGVERASGGGSVSGAAIVVQAICEVTGKSLDVVKSFLQKKLEADPSLTRQALYSSFRAPGTPTAEVIRRMEDEKRAKEANGSLATESLAELN